MTDASDRRVVTLANCSRRGLLSLVAGAFGLFACGPLLQAAGYPPEALRETPPEGIEKRSPKVGAKAPVPVGAGALQLHSTQGKWSLASEELQLLVFYRGAW